MVVTIGRKRSRVLNRNSPRYAKRSISDTRKMRKYLRVAFVRSITLRTLKDAGDHLLERRVLHAHVEQLVPVDNLTQRGGHFRAFDAQFGNGAFALGDGAVFRKV